MWMLRVPYVCTYPELLLYLVNVQTGETCGSDRCVLLLYKEMTIVSDKMWFIIMDQNIIDRCQQFMTADIVNKWAKIVLRRIYSKPYRLNFQNDLNNNCERILWCCVIGHHKHVQKPRKNFYIIRHRANLNVQDCWMQRKAPSLFQISVQTEVVGLLFPYLEVKFLLVILYVV
jgi:hypothetical protein